MHSRAASLQQCCIAVAGRCNYVFGPPLECTNCEQVRKDPHPQRWRGPVCLRTTCTKEQCRSRRRRGGRGSRGGSRWGPLERVPPPACMLAAAPGAWGDVQAIAAAAAAASLENRCRSRPVPAAVLFDGGFEPAPCAIQHLGSGLSRSRCRALASNRQPAALGASHGRRNSMRRRLG